MSIINLEAAEAAIVGAMLIDSDCVGDVLTRVKAEDFIDQRYRAIFEAARDLYNAGSPVDPVLVMDKAGGEAVKQTILDSMDATPTAANVRHYCEMLKDQAGLYRVREAGETLANAESMEAARDVLATLQAGLSDRPGVQVLTLAEMMRDFLRRVSEPVPNYLPFGLGALDAMLHIDRAAYVIIGARPSTGKTALGLQMGLSMANSRRVGFFSLETVPELAGDRIAAARLGVTLPEIQGRRVDKTGLQVLAAQMADRDRFGDNLTNFEFISAAGMSVDDVRTLALSRRYDVVFIDYVQLLRSTSRGERAEQMQAVSMAIRAMCQATGIVVIALAQLRRPESKTKVAAATMADLKESGQFEQDANVILLMYHETPGDFLSPRIIKIDKNKDGYAGMAGRFRFDGRKQTFTYIENDRPGAAGKPQFKDLDENQIEMELPASW